MNRPILFLPLALLALPGTAEAASIGLGDDPHGSGVGLILGEPTGIALAWRSKGGGVALDAALAWSIPDDRFHVHADWLLTLATYRDPAAPTFCIPFYTGIGPRVRVGWESDRRADAALLGVRVPFGLAILPDATPVDGFVEVVPVLTLYPETSLDFDAALGARVFFGRKAAPPPTP
ncbi:MAG: hypothetical protein JXB39_05055 [Deltaproteobacteria bacterium]|nr:hypothetical protein [Deltaproteobacteria bacterium]